MKNQKRIVFFVGLIVIITIAIQFYWNYVQYKNNKQQVINEIQISLDNAVDNYYTELSKKTVFGAFYEYEEEEEEEDSILNNVSYNRDEITPNSYLEVISLPEDSIPFKKINPKDIKEITVKKNFSITSVSISEDTIIKKRPQLDERLDEISKNIREKALKSLGQIDSLDGKKRTVKSISFHLGKEEVDSINSLENAAMKIVVSVKYDSINFTDLKTKINDELNRKNINFDYFLIQKNRFKIPVDSLGSSDSIKFPFVSVSQSALLPNKSTLEIHYPNIFWITLKKGTTGILLSLILSGAVIFSLFYLLHIIRKQKQLSEIKNDFISNITHELKTPIATVTSAVEGMQKFNQENDPEKTKKYLDISASQLDKLKLLVDKIMETSVLESKDLILEKKPTDVVEMIKNLSEKHKLNTAKNISFDSNVFNHSMNLDTFHFENAISNLIENAIKYGGNNIRIRFVKNEKNITIEISDNGEGIPIAEQKMIFDKFYRIPNKNKHNVRGFGIGLYYTKNIIEKHNGTIELKSDKNTTFNITL